GYFGAGMSWVYISIYYFGDTGLILSTLFTIALVSLLAIFPALALSCLNRLFKNYSSTAYWLAAWPLAWLGFEWLRSWIFTGLPWLNLGHTQIDGPLSAFYPVLGANLVSLLICWLVGIAILLLRRTSGVIVASGLAAIILIGTVILTDKTWVTPRGESLSVISIQPKVAQDKKWDPAYRIESMWYLLDNTQGLKEDLVIWPEAAIPALPHQVLDFLETVDALAVSQNQTVLTGIPLYEDDKFYNGIILLGNDQGEYRKRHLVPFGEYVPYEEQLRGLIAFFDMPMSSFSKGQFKQPQLKIAGHTVAMAICYEIIFQDLVEQQIQGADYLVTLSNDAWFGDSHGPVQHLEIARIRALENGIPIIRSTNDGVSAFIDADGTLLKTLGKGVRGSLAHRVELYSGSTWYRNIGPLYSWFILFSILILPLLFARLRKKLNG
ncbi:MAG: apolipoprotein N-acyltransferase, partial [Gammaproteobacteria bacterium]|nr:apolipoprotein N-acyltransferase [Gammaproteobacteria bacterium]